MPPRTPRPCRHNGCTGLTNDRNGYCEQHRNTKWEAHQGGRSSSQRGYGSAWQRLRKTIVARDKGLCQACRRDDRAVQGKDVDHIIAKANGGTDDPSNLELLCAPCHRSKTANE